jgi:6-pyruvoyl-tetrahydropterin synthase
MVLPHGFRTVVIRGDEFKFCCAHFVSHGGFRERLHGHNYTVEVEATGEMSHADGYVIDFGILKKSIREVCKSLNEKVLIPVKSESMKISVVQRYSNGTAIKGIVTCGINDTDDCCGGASEGAVYDDNQQVEIECQSSFFSFPRNDCAMIDISFSTTEELSRYFAEKLQETLASEFTSRGIKSITVRVFERPTQAASFTFRFD